MAVPAPSGGRTDDLSRFVPSQALEWALLNEQTALPAVAKDAGLTQAIEGALPQIPTAHRLILGDSRDLREQPAESVHLALTSPPYWTLKAYPTHPDQLGGVAEYEAFLDSLDEVWRHVYRALVPGGRLVVVVGDVCIPRRRAGRHMVYPLHASIQERCRRIGFDNLAPIIWYKIANAQFEAGRNSGFLGKPYEPNGVVKNDVEYILFQRKPGGYRSLPVATRILSVIPEAKHREWFQQIWTLHGASTKVHPAPYPLELAHRLVRMFSFVGDTVLDPFMGSGTTGVAAALAGRHSIGVDVERSYVTMAYRRLREAGGGARDIELLRLHSGVATRVRPADILDE